MRCGRAVGLALWLIASSARAHPSPAEPPSFFPDDCIVVIDKREHGSFHLDYAVLTDDTAPEVDHVSLPDSKTHQFFALSGTLFERATTFEIVLSGDEQAVVRPMPTWLDEGDVMRTAAAVTPEDMTSFTADQVLAQDILANDPVLSQAVRPLVSGTARVPITAEQATAGVTWDLRDVPPGVYQIAAYIFSPPYNGWAGRPGLIKIIDGADAPPAVTLEPIAGRVFSGQGRRVRGCVDAKDGSLLEVSTRAQAGGAQAFEPWIMQPAANGMFELCLENTGLDEALELRVAVRGPDGALASTRSSDAVSLFSNQAACVEGELLCCPAGEGSDAGIATDASQPMTPIDPSPVVDAGVPDGPMAPQAEPTPAEGTGGPMQAQGDDDTPAHSGCAVREGPLRGHVAAIASLLALLAAFFSRRGSRHDDARWPVSRERR